MSRLLEEFDCLSRVCTYANCPFAIGVALPFELRVLLRFDSRLQTPISQNFAGARDRELEGNLVHYCGIVRKIRVEFMGRDLTNLEV